MVWPNDWFYSLAESADRSFDLISASPEMDAYTKGFIASYTAIAAVESGLRHILQKIGKEGLMKPLQAAGFATMVSIPVALGILDADTVKETMAQPEYAIGLWGLFSGNRLQDLPGCCRHFKRKNSQVSNK